MMMDENVIPNLGHRYRIIFTTTSPEFIQEHQEGKV
jgi:hypothetical protein